MTLAAALAGSVVVGAAAGASGVDALGGLIVQSANGPEVTVRGCPIRFDGTTGQPYIHTNNWHACPGVQRVYLENGNLVVEADFTGQIIAAVASPDETLASRGVTAGITGGGPKSTLWFAINGTRVRLPDKRIYEGGWANVWVLMVGQR